MTSVQASELGKRILQADKPGNHVLDREIWQLMASPMARTIVYRRDFLFTHTTIVSGIENYPSTSMSWRFDGLAQLLLCLDL